MSYTINKEFMLVANEGDSRKAQNWYIIAHETANPRATGRNEASYMKNNWRNAYTTHIVGDGIVYLIGEPGYVSWGALDANCYAPAQIELQHTTDKALFEKNYRVYVELIRDLCNQFGIPKTLDAGGKGIKGVKSHQWVTQNYGGDHTDPYGYLASMGISKEQFARDIANGFGS
ncbi:TPA: peptidoglycan recognition protein, partial [Campylobacter coli]|nr:peptidoglycan recognition protein [Campylobacter coli]